MNRPALLVLPVLAAALAACGNSGDAPGGNAAAPAAAVALPAPSQWTVTNGLKTSLSGSDLHVDGDNTRFGYQIASPAISVPPNTDFRVHVDYTNEQGKVCLGVLSQTPQQWLFNNGEPGPEVAFNSGGFQSVLVVLANCNKSDQGNPNSRFTLRSGTMSFGK